MCALKSVLALLILGVFQQSVSGKCISNYFVSSGDKCENIAKAYGTTVSNLLALNPGLNCNNLPYGQNICVAANNECDRSYTIHQGDTCANIVVNLGITINDLNSVNPNLNCNGLLIGSIICLPPNSNPPPNPTCSQFYSVVQGDICYSIAGKQSLSLNQLLDLNPGVNCYNLSVGQQLCVKP